MSDIENDEQNNDTEPAETVEEGTPAEPEAAVETEAVEDGTPAEPEAAVEETAEAEAPAEEPVAEEPVAAEQPVAEAPAAQPAPPPAPEPEPARQRSRKHVPRSLRRTRTKVERERPKTRKPIVRLEKPEHERGRRQERQGTVVSNAMDKTIVVKVDTLKAHRKYQKVVRRSNTFHAHDEANQANVGDVVRIVETRPVSKTKRWRLAEILEAAK